jgi:WD40 repeat protein
MLDGRPVAVCGGGSGRITTWELETGSRAARTLESPDLDVVSVATGELRGRAIAVTGNYFQASQGAGILRVWDLHDARLRGSLLGHYGGVEALAITRVEDRPVVVSGGWDHAIRVWDLEASLQEGSERVGYPYYKWLLAYQSDDRRVVVSQSVESLDEVSDDFAVPDDDEVPDLEELEEAAARGPRSVITTHVWDQADGLPIGIHSLRLDFVDPIEVAGTVGDEVLGVSVAGRELEAWNLRTGERVGPPVPTGDRFDPGRNIAIGAFGERVIVAFCDHDGRLQVWDARAGKLVYEPVPPYDRGPAACWAFGAPAGRPVAVVATVGRFGIWDLERRDVLAEPRSMQREAYMRGPAAVGYLAGRPVAVYSNYARPILVWDFTAAREHAIHVDAEISAITVTADSTILAGGPAGLLALQVEAAFFDSTMPE